MFVQFPVLYPDEDFRSIVYRFHVLSGNKDLRETNIDLFNKRVYRNAIFPRNLSSLMEKMPNNYISVESLLHNHTYFGWLKPFVPTERLDIILEEIMLNKGESNIVSLLGKGSRRLITDGYRYCPVCIANDYKLYGEAYLHRKHQFSFMTCCPEHNIELITCCSNCGENFENRLVTSPQCICGFNISETDLGDQHLKRIKYEQEILNNFEQLIKCSDDFHLEDIQMKIRNILGLKGYMKYSGSIERTKLIKDFNDYLTANKFNQFLIIDADSQMKTEAFILRGNQVKSILFHILFMMFLSGSVEEFLMDNSAFSIPIPFGNGPWVCHNPVCRGFNEKVIKQCVRVDQQGKYISGLFGCPLCGFSFAKRWRVADQGKEKPYAVLTMGHLWHSILIELHSSGLSNTQISKKLNTTQHKYN